MEKHIGHDYLVLKLGMHSYVSRVLIRADVVPRPAVKSAFLDPSDVVWHKVVTEAVALIDRAPKLSGLRMDRNSYSIADARRINSSARAIRVEFQNISPIRFAQRGIFVDV